MSVMNFGLLLMLAGLVFGSLMASQKLIHYFQLDSYQWGGFFRTLLRQPKRSLLPGAALAVFSLISALIFGLFSGAPAWLIPLAALVLGAFIAVFGFFAGDIAYAANRVKKPLVYTGRVKRLALSLGLILTGISLACGFRYPLPLVALLLPALLPIWFVLATALVWPFEKLIYILYILDAEQVLKQMKKDGLEVIGITGSYGKTSTKNLLLLMLSQRFNTLATPASVNTPMGISRCIREDLTPAHRFLIAEMGARHPRDIQILCRFVKPRYGILTAIGPQHLETMGPLERIASIKYDLIRALPKEGHAVFSADGALVEECYHRAESVSKTLAGKTGDRVWAEDWSENKNGSSFTLCTGDGARVPCKTELLGRHNVYNILSATAMALHFGLSPQEIALAVSLAKPAKARLEKSKDPFTGALVLNNGFNANPESSKKALEVLSAQEGRHIVVTPGYIEQGRREAEENRHLGERLAQAVDFVILVGEKRTRPIMTGLRNRGFETDKVLVVDSLQEANAYLRENCGPGDVILYENDLGDQYC